MGLRARSLHAGNMLVVLVASGALGVATGVRLPAAARAAPSLGAWTACIGIAVYAATRREEGARVTVFATVVGVAALVTVLVAGPFALAAGAVAALVGAAGAVGVRA